MVRRHLRSGRHTPTAIRGMCRLERDTREMARWRAAEVAGQRSSARPAGRGTLVFRELKERLGMRGNLGGVLVSDLGLAFKADRDSNLCVNSRKVILNGGTPTLVAH